MSREQGEGEEKSSDGYSKVRVMNGHDYICPHVQITHYIGLEITI